MKPNETITVETRHEEGMVALRRTLSRHKCKSASLLIHELKGIVADLRIPPEAANGVIIEMILTPSDYDCPGSKSSRILATAQAIEDHWLIALGRTIRKPLAETVRLKTAHQEAIMRNIADSIEVDLIIDGRVVWSEEIKESQKESNA